LLTAGPGWPATGLDGVEHLTGLGHALTVLVGDPADPGHPGEPTDPGDPDSPFEPGPQEPDQPTPPGQRSPQADPGQRLASPSSLDGHYPPFPTDTSTSLQ
jgi:hypothetical protein